MKSYILLIIFLMAACTSRQGNDAVVRDKAAIIRTELDFAKMTAEKGIAEAFYTFADTGAVINRSGMLIRGRDLIRDYYELHFQTGTILEWTPDFVDVSGDIGYTYGKYTHATPDSTGQLIKSHGIFHTVWKRQSDGSWLFVWD